MKLGIDFGTCYSFMATMIGTDVRTTLVDNADMYSGIPTLFMHTNSTNYFGRDALERCIIYPSDYIKEIKRDVRSKPERITLDTEFTYPERGKLGGKSFKAERIVELFIAYLVDTAKKNAKAQGIVGSDIIDEITITTPVGLNSDSTVIEATALYNEMMLRVAKKVTGITDDSRVHVLGEPVAAAMYNLYKNSSDKKQTVLVYDLGGGTIDVAIVEYNPREGLRGKFDAVATGGYTDVGGGNWGNRLKEIVRNKTNFPGVEVDGGYVPEDLQERVLFNNAIEEAKIYLSKATSAVIDFVVKGENYQAIVSRQEFEEATGELLGLTITAVDNAICNFERIKDFKKGTGIKRIDRIVLVGGASQMPQVRRRLREEFPGFPEDSIYLDDPQLAIAAGAAINNDMPVIPRVLHTYGIASNYTVDEVEYNAHKNDTYVDPDEGEIKTKYWILEEDGVKKYQRSGISNIIMKGDPIDTATGYAMASHSYCPLHNNQSKVTFKAYVSESSEKWSEYEKKSLFGYEVNVPSEYHGRATQYSIIAEFRITADGVIELNTYEKKSGRKIHSERFIDLKNKLRG